ncbi:CDP-glucose 4,6-dehydratase [Geomesophilobacter sediminis]|uniref:CDP-glucose 4,6-dehydratase n=1 Tax=Geomesophilobacter sediminis TaxID=2798584 RepID=A0A8J7M478_9BACT|nr:CDP-glucose 4,6-dehydratase [Geomesophilobacter sediminis]MBJ6727758.1 CDP-glucose 4,6-dehydratase [Geomesophilobacter sediminis]
MEDLVMNGSFWKGKSVFITGHTGFKGTWLTLWLKLLGARVTGYALNPPTDPSMFTVTGAAEGIVSRIGDVCDAEALAAAMREAAPEVVFHLAAQPLVRASYQTPAQTFATNVMGTVNFLEAVRRTPSVAAAVVITSDKCYENREWDWGYRENEPMGGNDPYSASKGCAELVTASYRRSFFAAAPFLATARAGNVIGGGDWAADRLVPDLIRACAGGVKVQIRNPDAIRPWQHVLEPLRGYLTLARKLHQEGEPFARGWNFGPRDEDARPTLDLVSRTCALWGEGAGWELVGTPQPHEAKYLKLDCSAARAGLKWQPALNLETALDWTVSWYRTQLKGGDMREFTLRQIENYQTLASGETEHGR